MPVKINITPKILSFLKENRLKMSQKEMAKVLGIGPLKVSQFLRENNLQLTKEQSNELRASKLRGRSICTPEQDAFIKENYLTIPVKTMARLTGMSENRAFRRIKQLGLVIPPEIIEQRKRDSYYKKGNVPENKGKKQSEYMSAAAIEKTKATRFKKGSIPHNTNYNGHERISRDGYIEVRVTKGQYKLKHRLVWEQHNGKIPENHLIVFKDNNSLNIDINNLECISQIENMYRNSKHNYPKEIIPSLTLTKKIEHKLNSL